MSLFDVSALLSSFVKRAALFVRRSCCSLNAAVHEWCFGRLGWQAPCLCIELSTLRPFICVEKAYSYLERNKVPVLHTHVAEFDGAV